MKTALWIIALCDVIRATQNAEQLKLAKAATLADERRKKKVAKRISDSLDNLDRKWGVRK